MTLSEGVVLLNRLAERFALEQDYDTVEKLAFVIKQIKAEQTKPKGRRK